MRGFASLFQYLGVKGAKPYEKCTPRFRVNDDKEGLGCSDHMAMHHLILSTVLKLAHDPTATFASTLLRSVLATGTGNNVSSC